MSKGIYCVTHTDKESLGRCVQCHRPYCEECLVSTERGSFCSLECKGRYHDFREREGQLPPLKRPWVRRLIIKLVVAGVLAVGAYLAYGYFIKKDPTIRDRLDSAADSIQKEADAARKKLER